MTDDRTRWRHVCWPCLKTLGPDDALVQVVCRADDTLLLTAGVCAVCHLWTDERVLLGLPPAPGEDGVCS